MFPRRLDEWNLNVINDILKYNVYEGLKLDFKDRRIINKSSDLEKVLCSMANSSGGFIILGLSESKDVNNNVNGYTKDGFPVGQEDSVHHIITQKASLVEPYPTFDYNDITENNTFFTVIEVIPNENHKPYFTQDGRCYIRIGESSKPATRSLILSMFIGHAVPWDLKMKHFAYIIQIYESLAFISCFINNLEYVIEIPSNLQDYIRYCDITVSAQEKSQLNIQTVPIHNLRHVEWAISHLEAYPEVFEVWQGLKEKINKFNSLMEPIKEKVSNYFVLYLKSFFPDFKLIEHPSSNDHIHERHFVDIRSSVSYIIERILINKKSLKINDLKINIREATFKSSMVEYEDENLKNPECLLTLELSGKESPILFSKFRRDSLDELLLRNITFDIIKYCTELSTENFKLDEEITKSRIKLRNKMRPLITDLQSGDILKGTCKIGY